MAQRYLRNVEPSGFDGKLDVSAHTNCLVRHIVKEIAETPASEERNYTPNTLLVNS